MPYLLKDLELPKGFLQVDGVGQRLSKEIGGIEGEALERLTPRRSFHDSSLRVDHANM